MSCSFSSYLHMRGYSAGLSVGGSPSCGGVGTSGPVAAAPLHHHAPSPNPLDVGSPSKRQRNRSPDSSAPQPEEHHHLSNLSVDATASYFGAFVLPSSDSCSPFATVSTSTLTTAAPSPVCPLKSILCAPSSPSSTVPSSPCTSPPVSRPVSRRSSTSKSVRFARCTNASVFPTHSTTEYDRSPIVPTCEAQSLEIKRCKNDDDDGEWVQCQAREKAAQAAAAGAGARLPKHAPAMENPVEGVHGLIEGAYFVGEERDDPAFPATTPPCGALGVQLQPHALDIPEALDEVDEDAEFDAIDHGVDGDGEYVMVDDSAESDEAHLAGDVPSLSRSDSSDEASSSEDLAAGAAGPRSSSPEGSVTDAGASPEEQQAERERRCAERKKKFGLCALGKWTRQDLFHSTDSLGGF
ncbi:hypothetical protein JCM10450v2_006930 [Rhodotorula kratochvilovae]